MQMAMQSRQTAISTIVSMYLSAPGSHSHDMRRGTSFDATRQRSDALHDDSAGAGGEEASAGRLQRQAAAAAVPCPGARALAP